MPSRSWLLIVPLVLLPTPVRAEDLLFERDVLPILNAHCLACHGGVHQRNGLDLRTFAGLSQGGNSGKVIEAGNPEKSLLWQKLARDEMPKTDNKVSAANKKRIEAWIAGGARSQKPLAMPPVKSAVRRPAEVALAIDRAILAPLKAAKITPAAPADDATFLRRLSLDLTGRLPSVEETRAFLEDTQADKREKLIEALLARPEYGKHFATGWVNLFYLSTLNQRPPHPGPYLEWLADRLNQGQGWDKIVRETLAPNGFVKDHPPALFYYYNADMNGQFDARLLTGNISQVFLGLQMQCAECHHHPFSDWKQTDFWGLAAFFANTTRTERVENKMEKGVGERHLMLKPGQAPPKEVSISIPKDGEARSAGTKVRAMFLGGADPSPDAAKPHRAAFADWLTSESNPYFHRAYVNRLWAHFLGRGFVHPLNDFNDFNPPSHPEVLEILAREFLASGCDPRHLIRCICRSEAYQRSGRPAPGRMPEPGLFAHVPAKVMTPEVLHDALCSALGVEELETPPPPPRGNKPPAVPPTPPREKFIAFFRSLGGDDDPTVLGHGVPQALRLMNQPIFNEGCKRVAKLVEGQAKPEQIIEELFLAALTRRPTTEERAECLEFLKKQSSIARGAARLFWVLLNSSEFVLNH